MGKQAVKCDRKKRYTRWEMVAATFEREPLKEQEVINASAYLGYRRKEIEG